METLLTLFALTTTTFNLPTGLLSALCYVESGHHVGAYLANDGGSPSHGVCQVKLETARLMGFRGTPAKLKQPKVNIYYAGKYLAYQMVRYNHDSRKAIAAYNAGTFKVNRKGQVCNRKYLGKVMIAWAENK